MLLAAGANKDAADENGIKPVDVACKARSADKTKKAAIKAMLA